MDKPALCVVTSAAAVCGRAQVGNRYLRNFWSKSKLAALTLHTDSKWCFTPGSGPKPATWLPVWVVCPFLNSWLLAQSRCDELFCHQTCPPDLWVSAHRVDRGVGPRSDEAASRCCWEEVERKQRRLQSPDQRWILDRSKATWTTTKCDTGNIFLWPKGPKRFLHLWILCAGRSGHLSGFLVTSRLCAEVTPGRVGNVREDGVRRGQFFRLWKAEMHIRWSSAY